uniref:hypothetical protein n=1 Tax=Myxobolus shantungensis TaxID=904554 RepID=UPI00300247BF
MRVKMLSLYFFIFLINFLLILFFLTIYLLDLGIWFLIFNNIISILLFFSYLSLILNFKLNLIKDDFNFKKFIIYYLIFETCSEFIFFLGYLLNFNIFYEFILIFRLGIFPFIQYKFILNSLNFKNFLTRFLLISYLFSSKIWFLITTSWIFISYYTLTIFMVGFYFYFIITHIYNFKEIFFKSLIFSSLNLILISISFPTYISFFYIITSTFFQFKSINIINKQMVYNKEVLISLIYLTFLNGSPLYPFNFIKILLNTNILSLNLICGLLYLIISTYFLFLTFYCFYFFNGKSFNFIFLFNKIIFNKILFLPIILFFFLIFNFLFLETYHICFVLN